MCAHTKKDDFRILENNVNLAGLIKIIKMLAMVEISDSKMWVKTQHNLISKISDYAREIQHIWRTLDFGEFRNKFHWLLICC